jgi:hypothetical protein
LGDPLFHAGQVAEDSGFFNGVSEGFFAIDMAIGVETKCGGRKVSVIRGGDNDAVNVLSVEELAEILVKSCVGELLLSLTAPSGVDIAKGNNCASGRFEFGEVVSAPTRDSDNPQANLLGSGIAVSSADKRYRSSGAQKECTAIEIQA